MEEEAGGGMVEKTIGHPAHPRTLHVEFDVD